MKVRPIEVKGGDRLLVPGDLHFDKHDPGACDIMLQVAAAHGVNTAALVGDTFESAGISRHGRPARKFRFGAGTIKAEERAARPFIGAIKSIVLANRGKRRGGLYCFTGNHEHWWAGVQDDYPGLVDTPWFELYGDLFDDWHVLEEYTALKLGPLLICHGHRLRGSLARYSAASVLNNYPGQNTLYGHTHRVDSCTLPTYKYGEQVRHGAWTIGHLRDIQDSLTDPFLGPHAERHVQGFALVDFVEHAGAIYFDVHQMVVERDVFGRPFTIYQGKVYR
jgi:hypothetical protein